MKPAPKKLGRPAPTVNAKKLTIEWWPIGRPKPYAKNPRKIPQKAIDKVALSLREYGWQQPLVCDAKDVVVVGHTRLLAAQGEKMTQVPVVVAGQLTAAQVRAYRLMDNRSHQESAWDLDVLGLELGELKGLNLDLALTGFDSRELDSLLLTSKDGEDDAPPVPEVPVSRLGDLWTLGSHRVLCGDATSAEAVARLMGGEKADMVFTDPPYGVGYTGGAKKRDKLQGDEAGTTIYADALPNLREAAADHAALYLWYADAHAAAAAAAAAGYVITAQVIWVKNNAQFVTSAHYKGKHEPCFYAHRRGKVARWVGDNNEVTVWEVPRAQKNEFHPTQKPVELAAHAIRNSSNAGDVVLDIFGGSGSTLIACEETERKGRLLELEPGYIDVIILRWQTFTGKLATLDGKTFNEVAKARRKAAAK